MNSRLEELKRKGAQERMEARVRELPEPLRDCGLAYVEELERNFFVPIEEAVQARQTRVEELTSSERLRLFEALLPSFGEAMASSWELQKSLPYQQGYMRKGFRAPKNAEPTLGSRCFWLERVLSQLAPYEPDLPFLLERGAELMDYADPTLGKLFAGLMAMKTEAAERCFEHLRNVALSGDTATKMGRYVLEALLMSPRAEGWEAVEKLLLAAQRQEGLRQSILESVDFAQREAFVRILRLIREEKLSRFAAVARAVAVWMGLGIDASETKWIDALVEQALDFLETPERPREGWRGATGEDLYLSLWAMGINDIHEALAAAMPLIGESRFDRRYPAVHFLAQTELPAAVAPLRKALADEDLRVVAMALAALARELLGAAAPQRNSILSAVREILPRLPKDQLLEPAIWDWNRLRLKQSNAASLFFTRGFFAPIEELGDVLALLDANGRSGVIYGLARKKEEKKLLSAAERELALRWVADASSLVRNHALQALRGEVLTGAEALRLEPLLGRKVGDLRAGIIELLLSQDGTGRRASVARLEASGNTEMQRAAAELRENLEPEASATETFDGGLGLFDPAQRTQPALEEAAGWDWGETRVVALLQSLDVCIEANREREFSYTGDGFALGTDLLGNMTWFEPRDGFPLRELWEKWWQESKLDEDPSLAMKALCLAVLQLEGGLDIAPKVELRFGKLALCILWEMLRTQANQEAFSLLLDVVEKYAPDLERKSQSNAMYAFGQWLPASTSVLMRVYHSLWPKVSASWSNHEWKRFWRIVRWCDEGIPARDRHLPPFELTLAAWKAGAATEADVYEQLFANAKWSRLYSDLARLTKRKKDPLLAKYEELAPIVDRIRERALDVELKRGDLESEATPLAGSLSCLVGVEKLAGVLTALGKENFVRGGIFSGNTKAGSFSRLMKVSVPAAEDSAESFTKAMKLAKVSRKRLIELALLAPQWARFAGEAAGIRVLEDAAYWLHAHTKDSDWRVDEQIRELWFAEISERTPLERQELLDGAVDVEWFHSMRSKLSESDWALVFDAAKYAAGGNGHRRAKMYAAVLDGKLGAAELLEKMRGTRDKDAVRAFGLAALPEDTELRRQEVLRRYEALQHFLKGSRDFGSMRQASEKLSFAVAMANLARTAGYADPQRLTWAMEAEATADLRGGSLEVEVDGMKATLRVNKTGAAEILYERDGKTLKDAPAAVKKAPAIAELRARKIQLTQQASRMRKSLEEAMVRGDRFGTDELREMWVHPLLLPMLEALVFVEDAGEVAWLGEATSKKGAWRIAHPLDLLASGRWVELQREVIEGERIQPFKQVFRELYVLTSAEKAESNASRRYDGQQLNAKQALAIGGQRGWVMPPEEGWRKTYHAENVSAWVDFLGGWFTPVEVDGLTLEQVWFTRRSDGMPLQLRDVPARVFSETMRDLDLIVSVAHRGGVDPEATASTVEMRAALLRETARLLKLGNIRVEGTYAFIDGKLGRYNLHLGSATVQKQPGGSVCILPVHSQHRGRVFLPFADNDPKTAEVISKAVLLAEDGKIKDPAILEQLRR